MRFLITLLLCAVAPFVAYGAKNTSNAKEMVCSLLAEADIQVNGTRPWDIAVHNENFYSRVLTSGSLGLGESYMDGWWDCPELDVCMAKIMEACLDEKVRLGWKTACTMAWEHTKAYVFNLQDKEGAKKVIERHYQLGNDLYQAMLGTTLAYSCGYWKTAENLDQAQDAKFDILCRKAQLKPGMTLLDIGCGWGGFAKYAAQHYGVKVVGVTLSANQAALAQKLCAGLDVEIRVQDYRDVPESFDAVISIGMFEHVGHKNYRTFMEIVHGMLKPQGIFVLHTIGSNKTTSVTDPWINKYIFPNSHLPSISQIGKSIEKLFVMEDWHNFGAYYDKTLMSWYANFQKSWTQLQAHYDERFYRMWKYYLLSCAGAFRARQIQLWQIVLSKNGVPGVYQSVR